MDNEMIERVSKAIYMISPCLNNFTMDYIHWENLQGPMKELAQNQAIVAIKALREPTEKMINIDELPYSPGEMRDYWHAMIDCILND